VVLGYIREDLVWHYKRGMCGNGGITKICGKTGKVELVPLIPKNWWK
jgi:hypothetical protein